MQGIYYSTTHLHIFYFEKLGNDKLRIGLYSCRVYDQAPQIRRCNKCQNFGHWVADCSHNNGIACAKCASLDHETINCTNSSLKNCINCCRAGISRVHPPHTADSTSCPCFTNYRQKFYTSPNQFNVNNHTNKGLTSQQTFNVTPSMSTQSQYPNSISAPNQNFSNVPAYHFQQQQYPMISNNMGNHSSRNFTALCPSFPTMQQPNVSAPAHLNV